MLLKPIFNIVNNLLEAKTGLRIQPSSEYRLGKVRSRVLESKSVDFLIDVGANKGQYVERVRKDGYKKIIYSFEPTSNFKILEETSKRDKNWFVHNLALSNFEGEMEMNISSNEGLSSSLLNPKEILNQGFNLGFFQKEKVRVCKLESAIDLQETNNGYLKLDVQGSEMNVLLGAESILSKFKFIEFESALVQLYEGETTHYEISEWLIKRGFKPLQLVVTHWDSNEATVSLDAIFEREVK